MARTESLQQVVLPQDAGQQGHVQHQAQHAGRDVADGQEDHVLVLRDQQDDDDEPEERGQHEPARDDRARPPEYCKHGVEHRAERLDWRHQREEHEHGDRGRVVGKRPRDGPRKPAMIKTTAVPMASTVPTASANVPATRGRSPVSS